MRRLYTTLFCLGLAAAAVPAARADEMALETDEQKVLYTLGLALSRNLTSLQLSNEEMAYVQAGLSDGVTAAEPQVDIAVYGPKLDASMRSRMTRIAQEEKDAAVQFCEAAAKEEGADQLEGGMVYLEVEAGTGASPGPQDTVRVHYHGTLRDGSVFDSSRGGEPATFGVGGVIPCFSQGLMRMKAGGKSKLTCPADLAYGDRGSPPKIMPGAALVFELELIEVVGQPAESPAVP